MSVRNAVYSRLSTYAGLISLVSTRIYTKQVPQEPTYPCVFYEVISMERVSALDGDSGTVDAEIRTISMGSTLDSAQQVADQVRAALQRWSGVESGVTIINVLISSEADYYNDSELISHVEQTYTIAHKE